MSAQAPILIPPTPTKTTGVALSGSGFLFPTHVGALAAFEARGYKITNIAGTSGGGLVAALYASGMNPDIMREIILTTDFSNMMSYRLWGWWNGLCDPTPLYKFMKEHTQGKKFKDTRIPLTLMSCDVVSAGPFEFNTTKTPDVELALGARATSSIPFIYPAVKYKGAMLVDGGVVNNIPIDKLSPNDKKIGVDIAEHPDHSVPETAFAYAEKLISILLGTNEHVRESWAVANKSTVLYCDVTGSFLNNNMTREQIMHLYSVGYTTVYNKLGNM